MAQQKHTSILGGFTKDVEVDIGWQELQCCQADEVERQRDEQRAAFRDELGGRDCTHAVVLAKDLRLI